jgi:hypothetical protein
VEEDRIIDCLGTLRREHDEVHGAVRPADRVDALETEVLAQSLKICSHGGHPHVRLLDDR